MTAALPSPLYLPFAGDGLVAKEVKRLVRQYGIRSAVETGTHQGATAEALAALVPMVYTIESEMGLFTEAQDRLAGLPNVRQYQGLSTNVLPGLLPQIEQPALYYLDAHWGGNYPLPQEVGIIAQHDPRPVILMHDMQVPGHPELHADLQPDGSLYCYEWVRPALETIHLPWRYYYNKQAEGLRIGVLFVVPDSAREEP